MAVALVSPMGSLLSRTMMWLLLLVGLGLAAVTYRAWLSWAPLTVVAAAFGMAYLASVEPSNYDTGLYHLGSMAYVRDAGTVVGLANLHDRFGFSSSMWPASVGLGLGLWDGGEYRLFNGVVMLLALADVVARLKGLRRHQAGTYVLSGGLLLIAGAVVQYPGRLIASSAQDTAAALFVVVSAAYLVDFLTDKHKPILGTIAIVTAAMGGAMRPLGWVFAAATVIVVLASSDWRPRQPGRRMLWLGVLGSILLGVLGLIRDALTSGWLLFPAHLFPLRVSWRVEDPTSTARAITAWARTPFQEPDITLASGDWVRGWVVRIATDWSIPALGFFAVVTLLVIVAFPNARSRVQESWSVIALGILPVAATLIAWFITAPDPRFAWGPIILLSLIPLGVIVANSGLDWLWWWGIALIGIALVVLAALRGSFTEITGTLSRPPVNSMRTSTLTDGTEVSIPLDGDQCWTTFPLCRPWYADPDVELRGKTWADGFQPAP